MIILNGTGVASSDFDPFTLATDPALWLRAYSMSGFSHEDAVGGGSPDDWTNEGTVGGVWTQTTANRRPTYQTNEINGRPVVRFLNSPATEEDGITSGVVGMSSFVSASAYTVFLVVRPTIGGGTDGSSRFYRRPRIFGTASSDTLHVGLYNTTFRVNHNQLTGPSVATPTFTVNNWYVVEVWFGGGTLGIKANNSTASTIGGAADLGSLTAVGQLGRGTDLMFDGDIAEAIAWNIDIGSTDRDTVRNGLATQYGITLLP